MIRVAALQMCSTHEVAENLAIAEKLIAKAAKQHTKLVVLPEMFAIMGKNDRNKLAVKEVIGSGPIQNFLAVQAKMHQLWLVGGSIPIAADSSHKIRSAVLVFNPQGEMVARYDKIHLFDVTVAENENYHESQTTEPGDQVVVVDTGFFKMGLAVCYDIRFPELFRAMLDRGAQVFAIPTAFTATTGAAHWEVLTRARAIENFCYVIGACQGGIHPNGRKTFGDSLIINPWGSIIAQQTDMQPGVITAEINLAELERIRKMLPAIEHRKV